MTISTFISDTLGNKKKSSHFQLNLFYEYFKEYWFERFHDLEMTFQRKFTIISLLESC